MSTGAVDPLAELAAICHERRMWLHVDAAYGEFAALTERGRAQLAGIELADSVTLDPHKWLYQPIECGCLLVRDCHLLKEAFTINPDYLADYKSEQVNFSDLGLQLTTSRTSSSAACASSALGRAALGAIESCTPASFAVTPSRAPQRRSLLRGSVGSTLKLSATRAATSPTLTTFDRSIRTAR